MKPIPPSTHLPSVEAGSPAVRWKMLSARHAPSIGGPGSHKLPPFFTWGAPGSSVQWLMALQDSGNPHYQDVNIDSLESYEARCLRDDPEGYNELFEPDWQPVLDELFPEDQDADLSEEEDEAEPSDQQKAREEHPIKKHQYVYDKSFFMADMHPEMDSCNQPSQPAIADRTIHDHIITVAPGEDQKPVDVCYDPGWDVKAYPHLSNMDGSNGLSHARQVM